MQSTRASRRQFLSASVAAATAAGVVPYTFTASAADDSSSDKLKSAAIGVGGQGSYISDVAAKASSMVAVCDVNENNARRFAAKNCPKADLYGDYRKVLDRKDVDAVVIAVPDHWHSRIVIDALKAGKHVYCEKPLTLTIGEGQKLTAALKEHPRVFQVGTQQRSEYRSMFLKAVVVARSGRLGDKLRAISSVGYSTSGGPFVPQDTPPFLDWNMWLGQAPELPFTCMRIGWNFRWWFDYSGGQATDWGVHHTDIAMWALGGEKTGAVEARGTGQFPLGRETTLGYLLGKTPATALPNSLNVATTFDCHLTLPNGNTINLTSGKNELIIEGDRGRLRVNRGSLSGKVFQEMSDAERKQLDEDVVKLYHGRPPKNHIRDFFDCIRNKTQPISDLATHLSSVNACHMANIAMLVGRPVKFDSEKQLFIGDDEATALIHRKQRAPWTV